MVYLALLILLLAVAFPLKGFCQQNNSDNGLTDSFHSLSLNPSQGDAVSQGSTNTTLGGAVKVAHVGTTDIIPPGSTILAQGEVVYLDKSKNKVTLRDANGEMSFYSVTDPSVLKEIREGDHIQMYK